MARHSAEATELANWLESNIVISQGEHAGSPMNVYPWQRNFISQGLLRHPISGISIPRGNGKTAFVAALACAAFVENATSLYKPNSEIAVVASNVEQGRFAFRFIKSYLDKIPGVELPKGGGRHSRFASAKHRLAKSRTHKPGRVSVCFQATKPLHTDFNLAWLCSTNQPNGHTAATRRCGGDGNIASKIQDAKIVVIGTRSDDDSHWWARYLADKQDYSLMYCGKEDSNIFTRGALKRANPSWNHNEALRKACTEDRDRALRDPAFIPGYKALRLNMGTAEVERNMIVSAESWQKHAECDELPPAKGESVWGIDMGGEAAMTAICSYWIETGRLETLSFFS